MTTLLKWTFQAVLVLSSTQKLQDPAVLVPSVSEKVAPVLARSRDELGQSSS